MLKEYFYHHVCHFCKFYSEDLKTCGNCKLVSYCSVNHQRLDWKNHKQICKCIDSTMKQHNIFHIFENPVINREKWVEKRISWMSIFECKLKRMMRLDEKQMILFPNVCDVCFIACKPRTLSCKNCHMVNYCSLQHKERNSKHPEECNLLKLCFDIEKISRDYSLNAADVLEEIIKVVHFQENCDYINIEEFIGRYFPQKLKFEIFKNCVHLSDSHYIALLAEFLSGSLTILSSALLSKTKNLSELNCLKIHVIGAGDYELSSLIYSFELLFHLLPALKELLILYVGPDIKNGVYTPNLCEKCRNVKRHTIHMEKAFYNEVIRSKTYKKPHMIVTFNSGFHEYNGTKNDTWADTVELLLDIGNIVLVFTSYSKQEATEDFFLIVKDKDLSRVKVHRSQEMNSFKSLRPVRDWEAKSSHVFFPNNFISVIETFD